MAREISQAARDARAVDSGSSNSSERGVAAPLEHLSAVLVGDLQELCEGGPHHIGHFLGAGFAPHGQPFGERGEARDVDEGQGSLDRADPLGGLVGEPPHGQPRDVRRKMQGPRPPGGWFNESVGRGNRCNGWVLFSQHVRFPPP